jgi:hypothetical protein
MRDGAGVYKEARNVEFGADLGNTEEGPTAADNEVGTSIAAQLCPVSAQPGCSTLFRSVQIEEPEFR